MSGQKKTREQRSGKPSEKSHARALVADHRVQAVHADGSHGATAPTFYQPSVKNWTLLGTLAPTTSKGRDLLVAPFVVPPVSSGRAASPTKPRTLEKQTDYALGAPEKRKGLDELLRELPVPEFSSDSVSDSYARLDHESGNAGRRMGKNDLWDRRRAFVEGAAILTTDQDFDHEVSSRSARRRADALGVSPKFLQDSGGSEEIREDSRGLTKRANSWESRSLAVKTSDITTLGNSSRQTSIPGASTILFRCQD